MQDAGLLRRPTSHHSDPQLPTVYTRFWVCATSSIHSNDRYFPPTPRCGGWRVTWDKHGMALADQFVGTQVEMPVLDGTTRRYINFDNAASTPALKVVRDGVVAFLENYASVHRGTGFKSQLSTWAYDQARREVLRFLDAAPGEQVCLFGKNTTDALNKLAPRLPGRPPGRGRLRPPARRPPRARAAGGGRRRQQRHRLSQPDPPSGGQS